MNSLKPITYPVHEAFYTFQGEGVHMGRAAYFIRLFGCDQRCHFCDSAGTWHKDWMPKHVTKATVEEILKQAFKAMVPGAFVVLTGGEPTLHELEPLIDAFHKYQIYVHLETAGHHPIPSNIDWVTLSPKLFSIPPIPDNVLRADEIKIIVESESTLSRDLDYLLSLPGKITAEIWLHPEWSKRNDPNVLRVITEMVKKHPYLRAGYQMHKLYRADVLDKNASKVAAPLGGDPARGSSI